MDPHWALRGRVDPYRLLEDAGGRIIDIHLRNSQNGVWSETLGEGDLDYTKVKVLLDSVGYKGWYTVELAYEEETVRTRSLEENLRLSREYVRELFDE